MLIHFVSIVEANNAPVFFLSTSTPSSDDDVDEHALNQQFIAEMALDFVGALTNANRADTVALLLVHNGVAVYGSLSNTGVKYLIGVNALSDEQAEVDPLMKGVQDAYLSYVCNPFYDEQNPSVTSQSFRSKIITLVEKV